MKILILSLGTRGDVQPYLALGRGLQAAGHHVTLCTSARFAAFVAEHGTSYAFMNDRFLEMLEEAERLGKLRRFTNPLSSVKTAVELIRQSGPIQRSVIEDAWTAARDIQPDLILYNSKMVCGAHFAERLGVPAAMAVLFPQFVPTREFPTIGFPPWNRQGWYHRLTYRVAAKIASGVSGQHIREWRRSQGLATQRRHAHVLYGADGSQAPVLHGFSRHVVPRPDDWPDTAVISGYWFLDQSAGWRPPQTLDSFLSQGEPPVYIGFGSSVGQSRDRLVEIAAQAIQALGLRAVIAGGSDENVRNPLPDALLMVDQVPHDWLFPRVAAVVHHGGAGTTAEGVRAGRPAVICPGFGDQHFWARQIHALGLGSRPIPQGRLTAEGLTAALREVIEDPSVRRRAAETAAKIRGEDGVATAVGFIEELRG